MRVLATIGLVFGLLAGLAACGIPMDDEPRVVEPPHGPYEALASQAPANSQLGTIVETLYLTEDPYIVPVSRMVEARPNVEKTLQDLVAGPTSAERAAGLGTALPSNVVITSVRVVDGIAQVTLGGRPEGLRGDERMAIGQIVCTLDARSDINGVAFFHQNERIKVPTGEASLTNATLTTADYEKMLRPR